MDSQTRKTMQETADILCQMDQCSDLYKQTTVGFFEAMTPGHRETLGQLVNEGPVEDGNVVSKSCRNDLMDWGLANRACVKGQQGYTVANYRGWDVFKAGVAATRFKET